MRLPRRDQPTDPAPRREVPPAVVGRPLEQVHSDVGDLWFPTSEGVIRPFIKKHGSWEPEEGALLRSVIRPGCRFLDVGANVGYFSLLAHRAAPDVVIDAVEPLPDNVALLRLNLWANSIRAGVWPLALTGGDRVVTLTTSTENPGDTRASVVDPAVAVTSLVAPGATADEIFDGRAFDVVKIDVQGFEPDVVLGMQGIIARSPGIVIVAEFWPSALADRQIDPLAVLDRYRRMGLDIAVQIGADLRRAPDVEIVDVCTRAGQFGQVNLVLRRTPG